MLSALFVFPETHAGTILPRKAKELRRQTGEEYYTEFERESQSLSHLLAISVMRPYRLLLTQPLIQLMSFYLTYNYNYDTVSSLSPRPGSNVTVSQFLSLDSTASQLQPAA